MQLLRYIVRPLSPWGTPLRSDTLCGLLLWHLSERYGPAACGETIDAFRKGTPPFALSSALPLNTVSSPRLPPAPRALFREWVDNNELRDGNGKALTLFEALQNYKSFRKMAYLPIDIWIRHAATLSLKPLFVWFCRQGKAKTASTMREGIEPHVSIDRQSGSAAEGMLFFNRLTWFAEDSAFHIYARAADPAALLDMLREVGDLGFGKDASTGNGRFSVELDTDFDPKPLENGGPHLLLCSVCASMDMSALDGWYAVEAKRGKVGYGFANPHKAPMILLQEGSVLRHLPVGPYVLEGIHADPSIVQVTEPLTLPCRLVEEKKYA